MFKLSFINIKHIFLCVRVILSSIISVMYDFMLKLVKNVKKTIFLRNACYQSCLWFRDKNKCTTNIVQ